MTSQAQNPVGHKPDVSANCGSAWSPVCQAWTKLFPQVMKPGGHVGLAVTDVQGEEVQGESTVGTSQTKNVLECSSIKDFPPMWDWGKGRL